MKCPYAALNEARRVLKSGGLAFISIPYLNFLRKILVHSLRRIYFFLAGLVGKKKYFWEYRYTKKELIRSDSSKKLVIVGDVPYKDKYAERIKSIVDPRVIFTGYVTDHTLLNSNFINS